MIWFGDHIARIPGVILPAIFAIKLEAARHRRPSKEQRGELVDYIRVIRRRLDRRRQEHVRQNGLVKRLKNLGEVATTKPALRPFLVEKARSFDEKTAQKLIADRNYQALDQMVIEHLLGTK